MDSKDWMVLKTLYEQRNITKAAELMYLSQPALSYRIQQIEKEFEVKILTRDKKGVQFTQQGEYLYKYSVEMLNRIRNVKDTLLSMDEKVSGILKIGSTRALIKNYLPRYIESFSQSYPDVEFNVRSGHSGDLCDMVRNREIHIGFVRDVSNWNGSKLLLMQERINIVSHRKLSYEDLPNYKMIAYNAQESLARTISNWWKDTYRQDPNVMISVDSIETAWEMVQHGLGYAILPITNQQQSSHAYLLPLMTHGGVPIVRESWMIYQDRTLATPVVKAFVKHITDNIVC